MTPAELWELDAWVAEQVMGLSVGWLKVNTTKVFGSWFDDDPDPTWSPVAFEGVGSMLASMNANDGRPYQKPEYLEPVKGPLGKVVLALPHYSTDIAAAWLVVEKLDIPFEMQADDERTSYQVRFNLDRGEWAAASSAPLAICLAAKAALSLKE